MKINKYIDHTNLKNTAKFKDIEKLCYEAIKYDFKSVCVYPYYVPLAYSILKDTNVLVCTVIGFPSGMSTTKSKIYEAVDALENGASEIDMVINIAALKNKDYKYIEEEIKQIKENLKEITLKVIVETCLLTKDEIIKMTEICSKLNVGFIKTSTGFSDYGARVEDVLLMNENKNNNLEIKASGGIRDYETALKMINAGATRIGTSNGVSIIESEYKLSRVKKI